MVTHTTTVVCARPRPVHGGGHAPGIRAHMLAAIRDKYPASGFDMSLETFPADDATDPAAYLAGSRLALPPPWGV